MLKIVEFLRKKHFENIPESESYYIARSLDIKQDEIYVPDYNLKFTFDSKYDHIYFLKLDNDIITYMLKYLILLAIEIGEDNITFTKFQYYHGSYNTFKVIDENLKEHSGIIGWITFKSNNVNYTDWKFDVKTSDYNIIKKSLSK